VRPMTRFPRSAMTANTTARAHHGAELDAATMAAVLARATGPSWSCSTRTSGRAGRGDDGAALPIPPPLRKGAALPKLGAAMIAVLARLRAELGAAPWMSAAHSAAVLKGAAQPIPPPF
jgi:hypothetical protein